MQVSFKNTIFKQNKKNFHIFIFFKAYRFCKVYLTHTSLDENDLLYFFHLIYSNISWVYVL